jgi:hypothetical protein
VFDCVVTSEVIEHVTEKESFISAISNLMKVSFYNILCRDSDFCRHLKFFPGWNKITNKCLGYLWSKPQESHPDKSHIYLTYFLNPCIII